MVSYPFVIPKTSSSLRFKTLVDESSSSNSCGYFWLMWIEMLLHGRDPLSLFLGKVGPSPFQRRRALLRPVTCRSISSCLYSDYVINHQTWFHPFALQSFVWHPFLAASFCQPGIYNINLSSWNISVDQRLTSFLSCWTFRSCISCSLVM